MIKWRENRASNRDVQSPGRRRRYNSRARNQTSDLDFPEAVEGRGWFLDVKCCEMLRICSPCFAAWLLKIRAFHLMTLSPASIEFFQVAPSTLPCNRALRSQFMSESFVSINACWSTISVIYSNRGSCRTGLCSDALADMKAKCDSCRMNLAASL